MRDIKLEVMFYAHNKNMDKVIKKHYTTIDRLCKSNKFFKQGLEIICKRQYTGLKDKNGVEIYEGDIVEYYDLYECHSDAVDYYGVEPQNNFPVSEVYPEIKLGVVEFFCGSYKVNSIDVSQLQFLLKDKIEDCYLMGNFGCSAREFIELCHDLSFKSPVRKNRKPKIVGNVYENPEMLK